MYKLLLASFFVVATTFISFGQTEETGDSIRLNEKPTKEWKVLTKDAYRISYPDHWEADASGRMGTAFIIFSPLSSPQDQFRENVNLLIQDLSGMDLDLNKYATLSINQIHSMITDSKIVSSERVVDEHSRFHKMVYSGKQGIYQLIFEQYYWVENNKAYVLTLTCEEDQFDFFKETGEKILDSFVLGGI